MNYNIENIAEILGAKHQLVNPAQISHLATDSRNINFPETTLFFALKGVNQDGASFISDLYKNAVRNFVVKDNFSTKDFPEANFILLPDPLSALQKLAAHHRQQFSFPVIGITGSNGKTIVKEWLYQLLQNDFNIVRSPKSYNSQLGVPLSIAQISPTDNLGIFEAGISEPGEMVKLQQLIAPNIGILTYLGEAHAEQFASRIEKLREKLLLFSNAEWLVYSADDDDTAITIRQFLKEHPHLKSFTSSTLHDADFRISSIIPVEGGSRIAGVYMDKPVEFEIYFKDTASVSNAISCYCLMLLLQYPPSVINLRMLQLKPVAMRLELLEGIHHCSIINDSYNADLDSLLIALDFLQQQQQHDRRTVILSDFLQSGKSADSLYSVIADLLQQRALYRFIGIGHQLVKYADKFSCLPNTAFFNSTDEFIQSLPALHFREETILLKGARSFAFEKISKAFERKVHNTLLEINLTALRHNLKFYRRQLRRGVKLMAMVKAFSYGSGSYEIASLLQHAGADYLGVAYADEGVELRKAGISLPIMVMNTEEEGFESIVRYNLEPELYSFKILRSFYHHLQENNIKDFPVHIKLDTGMHRLGFEQGDMEELNAILHANAALKIRSVFSHLVASDDPAHDTFTNAQYELFQTMSGRLREALSYDFLQHISNSSGIRRHSRMQLDMVRLGIGLYGVDSLPDTQLQLRNVSTLVTTISQIRQVKKGESVGYSRKAILDRDSTIATVRIGYADGYPRALGNGMGKMLLQDQLVPVVGNVCMDMTMIDITGINAKEEDQLIVFGEGLPVSLLATWAGTIPYEILTNISQRVKRIYFEE
ncbi:MAG: alanine racemase [Ferruginibacter sp.]|nr:alanine racemase [Ferruginibacter sp.]